MSVDPKLVRRIEGTLASPAAVQTKQIKIDVDTGGGPTDLTELIYKDAATGEHVYITKENTQDLISDSISSSGVGAFTIVTTEDELTAALQSDLVLDIYCKRVSANLSPTVNVNVQSSKNIYGGEGDLIFTGDAANYKITYPASGSTDITISFYVPISHTGSGSISDGGGFVGSPAYKTRYSKTDKFGYGGGTNLLVEYESRDTAIDEFYVDSVTLNMWTGRTYVGSTEANVTSVVSSVNAGGTSLQRKTRYDIEAFPYDTGGDPYAERSVKTESPVGKSIVDIFKERIESNPNFPFDDRFKVFFGGSVDPALMITEYGQLSAGGSVYPWHSSLNVVECGDSSIYYDSNTGKRGVCYGGYYDSGWRYKQDGVRITLEEWDGYDKKIYESDSTDTAVAGALAAGGLLPARYAQEELKYNYEFSTGLTGTVGTGQLQGNQAVFQNSTTLWINDTDLNGVYRQGVFFDIGSTNKLVVHVGSNWGVFTITSASWGAPKTAIVGSFTKLTGSLSPSSGENLILEYIV